MVGLKRFFNLVLAVPCIGIALRIVALGPVHPYLLSMYALVVIAWIARQKLTGLTAINFYCWSASIPVLYMVYAESALHPEYSWGVVACMPLAGLFIVAGLGRDLRSLLAYSICAVTQLAIEGYFYNSEGWTGVLIFTVCLVSLILSIILQEFCIEQGHKTDALETLEIIQRGLAGKLEALDERRN